LDLPDLELAALGVRLGADVPIFLFGRAAWATGVGEALREIAPPEPWYCLAQPACAVSTREIFSHPDLPRATACATEADLRAGRCGNDCEALVRRLYPPVEAALAWLGAGGRMTGTGACCFRPFPMAAAAEAFAATAPAGLKVWVAQGQNRSPLLARLAQERG
jgi:4-diphosphocytidyl-2-C-methyl-D-erythritol kinase